MNIYRSFKYRIVIKYFLDRLKKSHIKNTYAACAVKTGIQSTYLTKVLQEEAHFSTDQLYAVMKYLALSEIQRKYLFLLQQYEISNSPERRYELLAEIKDVQIKNQQIKENLKAKSIEHIDLKALQNYYLDPLTQIIHMFMTIPEHAKDLNSVLETLNLSREALQKHLEVLENCQIIKISPDGLSCQLLKNDLHLDKNIELAKPNILLLRVKALEKIAQLSKDEMTCFSVLFSVDDESFKEIQQEFVDYIKKIEAIVRAARPQKVVQMNFDLFPWSRIKS